MPQLNDSAALAPAAPIPFGLVGRWFADDDSFWKLAAIVFGIVNVLRGLQMPGEYAATQALTNYDHGMVKRGLFGASVGKWFHTEHFQNFAAVSVLLVSLFLGLLVLLTLRARAFRLDSGAPVALFFASYAVTCFVRLGGYLEIVLAVLVVGLLLIRDARLRFAAAVPVCVVAMLTHEMFLIVFLPVVLFSFIVDAVASTDGIARLRPWLAIGTLTTVSLLLALRLSLKVPQTAEQIAVLSAEYARRADFTVDQLYFWVLSTSFADNLVIMRRIIFPDHAWRYFVVAGAAVFGLTVVPLLAAVYALCRTVGEGYGRGLLLGGATVSVLAPLAMNAIATDTARWDVLACIDCFLVLLLLCRGLAVSRVILPPWYRNVVVLAIGVSMAGGQDVADGKGLQRFPFATMGVHLFHVLRRSLIGMQHR